MLSNNDDPSPSKPYAPPDDLAEPGHYTPPPAVHPVAHATRWLAGPLWLAVGAMLAAVTLGSPGCVGTGGPVVSAKGEVSVKEVSHHVALANADRGGEMTGSLSFEIKWPGK